MSECYRCYGCGCELTIAALVNSSNLDLWCSKECYDKYSGTALGKPAVEAPAPDLTKEVQRRNLQPCAICSKAVDLAMNPGYEEHIRNTGATVLCSDICSTELTKRLRSRAWSRKVVDDGPAVAALHAQAPKSKQLILPGKYSVYEKIGHYERCVSFQTLEEMLNYEERGRVKAELRKGNVAPKPLEDGRSGE